LKPLVLINLGDSEKVFLKKCFKALISCGKLHEALKLKSVVRAFLGCSFLDILEIVPKYVDLVVDGNVITRNI